MAKIYAVMLGCWLLSLPGMTIDFINNTNQRPVSISYSYSSMGSSKGTLSFTKSRAIADMVPVMKEAQKTERDAAQLHIFIKTATMNTKLLCGKISLNYRIKEAVLPLQESQLKALNKNYELFISQDKVGTLQCSLTTK